MKGMLQGLRKAEMLLLRASLKVDRCLGKNERYRPPGPLAVRVASHPLRSAAVLAVPIAALGGMTFGAFTDGTRFLQAVLLGTGLTLVLALGLRLERLTQLQYERVGHPPVPPQPADPPRPGELRRVLAYLCLGWGALSVLFWGAERAKGTPVSWLLSGVFTGLGLLGVTAAGYWMERKRQRASRQAAGPAAGDLRPVDDDA
ncbi:hypothetical protein OG381_44510 [Streptomyces sp. NBC_00490]|uniref:hypothetical protein n=1 Tax=Streptomyces sp. NBC_00490 TaxID=2903657 RepID=UPI002E1702EE